jgi:hypothetical protein
VKSTLFDQIWSAHGCEIGGPGAAAGRKRAIRAGKKMGPKFEMSPFQRAEAIRRINTGESMVDIGKSYNVSHATISRLAVKAMAAVYS